MEHLIEELKDVTSPLPMRGLDQIAAQIRSLAEQFKKEIDPLHTLILAGRGVSPITTL